MNVESLANTVEHNIVRVFKKFNEKPAVFLSKSDVMCYMYYLLVTDPFLGYSPTVLNLSPTIEKSKTFIIHAGLEVSTESKNKQVALSIGESSKETNLPTWDFPVGIEIEHNLDASADAQTTIYDDIEKVAKFKKGYLLCLNWDNPITDENIIKVKKHLAEHENVNFYYLDLCSKPARTNFKKIA